MENKINNSMYLSFQGIIQENYNMMIEHINNKFSEQKATSDEQFTTMKNTLEEILSAIKFKY